MTQTTPRITHRTRGTQRGFLRRMVSPGDLGEVMKPFIFLDHIHGPIAPGTGFGWHPHSGLATLTYSLNSDAAYEDTAGQHGLVEATGLEWMRAGGGTWHQGFLHPREATVTSFQLWVALPPGVEDGPPEGLYVAPTEVPQVGAVRVLLGEFGGQRSPIPTPSPLTYLDVALAVGATWAYAPPDDHDVLWAFVYRGRARIAGELIAGELVVLAGGAGALTIEVEEASRVLVGSAARHAYPLVLGDYSVHTNPASLARGEARIREVRDELRQAGRL